MKSREEFNEGNFGILDNRISVKNTFFSKQIDIFNDISLIDRQIIK